MALRKAVDALARCQQAMTDEYDEECCGCGASPAASITQCHRCHDDICAACAANDCVTCSVCYNAATRLRSKGPESPCRGD